MPERSLTPVIDRLPKKFENCGFKNFNASGKLENIKNECIDFTKNGKGSLVMFGNVGNGKTHLAVSILRNLPAVYQETGVYAYRPAKSLFLITDEFFAELNQCLSKGIDKVELINKYFLENDIILLDEIRIKNFTEAKRENLYLFINRAYLNDKRIIVTTNFTPEQLEEVDESIMSRLTEMSKFIVFNFDDYRTLI